MIELQESLRALGLYDGAIDGIYGPRTQEAVQEFQRLVRLPPRRSRRRRGMGFAVDGRGAFSTRNSTHPGNQKATFTSKSTRGRSALQSMWTVNLTRAIPLR